MADLTAIFGGSSELLMWLTDGFSVTLFGRWRGAVRIHVSHIQLPCTVLMCGVVGHSHVGVTHVCKGNSHVEKTLTLGLIIVWCIILISSNIYSSNNSLN